MPDDCDVVPLPTNNDDEAKTAKHTNRLIDKTEFKQILCVEETTFWRLRNEDDIIPEPLDVYKTIKRWHISDADEAIEKLLERRRLKLEQTKKKPGNKR